MRTKAETYLLDHAADLGPRELHNLGRGILEHLAPDIADHHDYQRLLAEEQRANAATRLTLHPRGDGATDLRATIPDHAAHRLRTYLNAYTSPRRHHLDPTVEPGAEPGAEDEAQRRPIERRRGEAFVALLEHLPTRHLPRHGGTATTVTITLDHQNLLADLGIAITSTGDKITAGQARRLACQAGILPVVLGGPSEILDVGRTRRLVTDSIRRALNLRDQGCTAAGWTMPADFCEAHHVTPWALGGRTSLTDCKLLCPFHHHRAHDPAWRVDHQPNGTTSFTRRQ